jgi:hypothetical protein
MLTIPRLHLLALIVGPGYWPLTAKTSLSVPSGAIVVFVISKVYYTTVSIVHLSAT